MSDVIIGTHAHTDTGRDTAEIELAFRNDAAIDFRSINQVERPLLFTTVYYRIFT